MILHNIYFSAKGTTELCAGRIGQGLNLQMKPYNWFEKPCNELLEISNEDVLLFSMPVYGGFIPQSCAKMGKNRMSNVVAGIGCGQMQHIEEHIQKKHEIYKAYKEAFSDIEEIEMNPLNREGSDNNWLSCMTISPDSSATPTQVMDALEAESIETRPIWKPMHLQNMILFK